MRLGQNWCLWYTWAVDGYCQGMVIKFRIHCEQAVISHTFLRSLAVDFHDLLISKPIDQAISYWFDLNLHPQIVSLQTYFQYINTASELLSSKHNFSQLILTRQLNWISHMFLSSIINPQGFSKTIDQTFNQPYSAYYYCPFLNHFMVSFDHMLYRFSPTF